MPEESSSSGSSGQGKTCLALLLVALTLLGGGAGLYWFTVQQTRKAMEELKDTVFRENITETFVERQLEVLASEGGVFEVATATATDTFERATELKLFNRTLPMGRTVSRVSVPATYRYHILLEDDWNLSVNNNECVVIAPRIRPTLPVAIDTAGIQKETNRGWARFDDEENLEQLESSISAKLAVRAASRSNIEDVREESRVTVANFVKNFLIREEQWEAEGLNAIRVIFTDEVGKKAPDEIPVTVTLEKPEPPVLSTE